MNPGPVGLEELEDSGRECDLPRKRPALWSADMGISMSCMVKDGKGFMCMVFFLGVMVVAREGGLNYMITGSFLGKG